jgi:lysophospholipase L1-like esterase
MTEWLRLRLARLCHAQGYALYSVIWPSSNLVWWGRSDTLAAFIRRLKPTYVLLCIGSNELFIPGIKRRRPYVERILSQVGSLPFVWIGPPNWKEDTGINAMLQEVAGPGRFFDSRRLTYERLEDGAHPTPTSAYRWADSIAAFLRDSALYPLLLPDKLPADKVARPDLSFFLQPNEP